MTGSGVDAAYVAWTEHRFFRYRGCAPDADDRRRAAGNPELSLDAWLGEDRDGGEPQKERVAREQAAKEVCLGCPVMVQCDAYGMSVGADGRLVEPTGIRGGRTALERHKELIRARHAAPAAPDRRFETPQKRAVLRAFAVVWDPFEVAAWAGVDVRTANWQRSNLVTLLGLPRTATRAQLLAAAGERGLLQGVRVVADDGSVPAVPPPGRSSTSVPDSPVDQVATAGPAQAETVEERQGPAAADVARGGPPVSRAEAGPYEPTRVPAPRRDRFTDIVGQLALWEAGLADVHRLFPADAGSLGAAA